MNTKKLINWERTEALPSRSFRCGHCGADMASERGWYGNWKDNQSFRAFVYICHRCTGTTFFDVEANQSPGALFGEDVGAITDDSVAALYKEARGACSAASYTAAVLACRKLLMHIAVAKGAKPGDTFVAYVQHLSDQHYVPPDAKDWVDHIRTKGNEANHEIVISSREDAEELISFVEMLLKLIYEFPAAARAKKGP